MARAPPRAYKFAPVVAQDQAASPEAAAAQAKLASFLELQTEQVRGRESILFPIHSFVLCANKNTLLLVICIFL